MDSVDSEAKKYFDQIASEHRKELLREIDQIEEKKWETIRDKMLKWLVENGMLPKNAGEKEKDAKR
jgi:hypothetical protein